MNFYNLKIIILTKSLFYKLSRKVYMKLRNDIDNNMMENGERWIQEKILKNRLEQYQKSKDKAKFVIFDVGANIGDWTRLLLKEVNKMNINDIVEIHCFEPVSKTFACLKENLSNQSNVSLWNMALSDREGLSTIYLDGVNSGTNSLHKRIDFKGQSEKIKTMTGNQFVDLQGINYIDFVKIDAEGHDFNVLLGFEKIFCASNVNIIQFEYNHRWLDNNSSLLDVFKLINSYDYCLCKLTSKKLLRFEKWHPELDRFFEGNYIIIKENYLDNFNYINMSFGKSNEPICIPMK